jgi:hypothetical protein
MCMASALGGATVQYVRSDKGHQALTTAPTDTEWFGRFMTGLRARIGEIRRQDAAISIALMIELQSRLEARWLELNEEHDWQEKRKAAENGAFFNGLIAVVYLDLKHRRYCYMIYDSK